MLLRAENLDQDTNLSSSVPESSSLQDEWRVRVHHEYHETIRGLLQHACRATHRDHLDEDQYDSQFRKSADSGR